MVLNDTPAINHEVKGAACATTRCTSLDSGEMPEHLERTRAGRGEHAGVAFEDLKLVIETIKSS